MFRESTPQFSDEEFRTLLESARRGDHAALTELWQALAPRLRREADQRVPDSLRSECAASDLVQDTYIRFQTRLATFQDHTCDQLTAWLLKISVNLLIDKIRRLRSQPQSDLSAIIDSASSPSSGLQKAELRAQVRQCLEQLSAEDQEVLELRVFCDLEHKDAAQILGISLDAFAKRYHRALDRLRRGLGDKGITPSHFGGSR